MFLDFTHSFAKYLMGPYLVPDVVLYQLITI